MILRSTKSDAFVMVLTMVVTIAFDLILAIEVGLVAAAILFIVRMSSMFTVDPVELEGPDIKPLMNEEDGAELASARNHLVVFRVEGPIFFGAAERFIDQLVKVDQGIKVVVLRLRRVPVLDATGVTALRAIHDRLERRGIGLILSGLQPQPATLLKRTGVYDEISDKGRNDMVTTEEAIAEAKRRLLAGV
jgi:SulP family sulfate permease